MGRFVDPSHSSTHTETEPSLSNTEYDVLEKPMKATKGLKNKKLYY